MHDCVFRVTVGLLLASAFVFSAPAAELDHRRAMIGQILAISEQVVPNPAWLESEEWQSFVDEIQSPAMLAKDEVEFARAFNRAAADLPFSHYRLQRRPRADGSANQDHASGLTLTEAAHGTAILTVDHFAMSGEVMGAMVDRLRAGEYRNLVLDFRGHPGGSFPAGMALGRFLSRDPVDTGVYLTRRWFLEHGDYPTLEQIAAIEPLAELNLDAFARELEQHGVLRIVVPAHDEEVFDGRLFVLTSRQTASAAEPFVDLVSRFPKHVTVIGEPTAGSMLSGERFPVSEDWMLFAPVADFLTDQGRRLDGVGVQPHVEVPAELALETALRMIEEGASMPEDQHSF